MAYILGKDLDKWDDSVITTAPFSVPESQEGGAKFMTGKDLLRSAVISSEWKAPVAVYSQASNELKEPRNQATESLLASAVDSIRNFVPNVANSIAQRAIEIAGEGEPKPKSWLKRLYDDTEIGQLEKQVSTAVSLGILAPSVIQTRQEIKEKADTVDKAVDLLNGREYPISKYAQRIIAETTRSAENRKMVRELFNQAHGVDATKWYNQAGTIIGAMVPAMMAGRLGYSGARFLGTGRAAAVNIGTNVLQGYMSAEMAGQYAEETAARYLEKTGDIDFENFSAKDATGLSSMVYGAIAGQIEVLGGVEPIVTGALKKVGLRASLGKAMGKIALGEASEELLQGALEILMRKMEGSTDKTWGDGIKEALVGAIWGALIGGTVGTTAFHVNRRNLVRGIKEAFPKISDAQATQIADAMIDSVGETVTQDHTLRDNLREKVAFMYKNIDLDNKEDRIDAITDLEYSLAAMDATDRGIDLTEHEIFQGEVTPIGWFRAGIPEAQRTEIQAIIDNIAELETQLKELNEAKEKDWAKIEELESKLAQADQYVLDKLSDLTIEFKKLEDKYVYKQKEKATKQAIKSGSVDVIKDLLSKAGFRTRDLSGTQVKELAKLNWRLLQDQNLGAAQSRSTKQVPLTAIEQNVESGDAVLLRAGYTQAQIDKMDDETWNRAILTQYRKEELKTIEPEYTEEDLAGIEFQEQFDLADENARLDDIYPEYKGETININGKDRTVYNSEGKRIAKSAEALRNFYKWFGDSKVVDEEGRPLVVYHGSTRKFVEFDISKSSKESNLGAGFYFTDNEEDVSSNYEGGGADFDDRVDRLAEQIEQEEGIDYQEARIKAYEQEFAESTKYDVYLKMEEPFVIGGKNETVLTFEEKYNEETDEYEEPTGTLLDFAYALDNELADLGIDDYKISTALFERAAENDGTITASEINELLDGDEQLSNMLLDYGNESTGQLLSDAVGIEYDGFIDHTVSKKFGSERNVGVAMAGVDSDTTHYVAFNSNQIKSVDNRGTYSSDTGNIYWQNRVSGGAPSTYRGAYIPEYRFILRANRMDASTLSHELAHDWFEVNFNRYRSGKATKDFMRAWGALEKALGITEKDKVSPRKASETFARAYEAWITGNEDWSKFIAVEDKDKNEVEKLLKDYQGELRDIYNDISNPYFKQTWGKLGELKPELKAWFDRVVNITDLDVLVERGEMTEEQATTEKLNRAIDSVIENTEDAETAQTLKEVRTLNDTKRYEVEGGNKNSIQRRLSKLAREIDENNMVVKGEKYDTHRDMMAVAEAADNFVKTRLDDALAIINGQMAEVEGLFKEDLYTALERLAIENGDLGLLDELKNSEIANNLAKELGQRVVGFRNFKQSTDLDIVSALKSLDNRFGEVLKNKKAKQQYESALKLLEESIIQQDKIADKELDSFLKDLECK